MLKKIIFIFVFIIGAIFLLKYIFEWHNPYNEDGFNDPQHCIFDNKNHKEVILNSIGNNFNVAYVESMSKESFGPYFPAVHIATQASHDKWILLMHNQGDRLQIPLVQAYPDPNLFNEHNLALLESNKYLEDKLETETVAALFRFYSSEQDFFKADVTAYGVFQNKNAVVKSHAYAVQVDLENKTVRCVGGISWGYKLTWWSLSPIMILPQALSKQDWQNDWTEISKRQFKEYKDLTA